MHPIFRGLVHLLVVESAAAMALTLHSSDSSRSTASRSNSSNLRKVSAGVSIYGDNACPCVGIDNIKGYYAVQMDYYHVQLPAEAGASCDSWDQKGNMHPACREANAPVWCSQPWCYVDPCNCNVDVTPKKTKAKVEYQGQPAHWSYYTCGGIDFYTKDAAEWAGTGDEKECAEIITSNACAELKECAWDGKQCLSKDQLASCEAAAHVDEAVAGEEDCRCVGLGGSKFGKVYMHINDTDLAPYPPTVGAECRAWEKDAHPECQKDGDVPSWCSAKWCFVDPCKCKTKVPPRTVMKANSYMRFQGKTAYFSYETCGNEDTWTSSHEGTYCIHFGKEVCMMEQRCAWNGEKCLGKALVETCEKQKETGVLSVEGPLQSAAASSLPLMMLFAAIVTLVSERS